MLQDLYLNKLPKEVSLFDVPRNFSYSWDVLKALWSQSGVTFREVEDVDMGLCWEISEDVGEGGFLMRRSKFNLNRNTIKDTYGLLGLSLINPKDTKVILTEGVSDYFTAKLYCPQSNVLGVTTLSGSHTAKRILLTLFNSFIICSDNDSKAERNTGLMNADYMKSFLSKFGKTVSIFIPETPHKDITDNFMFNLKLNMYE